MSQWAEIRHLHLVERVPKKEIARRLKLDVKTVRRAISRSTPPVRVSPTRPGTLDPWRERIRQWLREEPRLTAKRIRRLLLPMAGPLPARTVRWYVAGLRTATTRKEAFVHRSVLPGTTMEVDFGESWVDIAGVPCRVKYLVATLPFSNAYFAKGGTRSSGSSRCSTASSRRSATSGASWTASCSTTPRWRSRTCWRAGTGCRPRRSMRSGAGIRSGPSSARRPRAGKSFRLHTTRLPVHAIQASGVAAGRVTVSRDGRRAAVRWAGSKSNVPLSSGCTTRKLGILPLGYWASPDRPITRVGGLRPCPRRS